MDWEEGDEIIIATTDFDHRNSEERTIASLSSDGTKTTVYFDSPLDSRHFAGDIDIADDFT